MGRCGNMKTRAQTGGIRRYTRFPQRTYTHVTLKMKWNVMKCMFEWSLPHQSHNYTLEFIDQNLTPEPSNTFTPHAIRQIIISQLLGESFIFKITINFMNVRGYFMILSQIICVFLCMYQYPVYCNTICSINRDNCI